MRTDIRPAGGWGCLLQLLLLPFLLVYALFMACNSGPGCSCNCTRYNGKGQVIGGCSQSNHCGSHSSGCHVSC